MIKNIAVMTLVLILSCSMENYKIYEITICSEVPPKIIKNSKKSFLLISPGQMKPSYTYKVNEILYSFCVNEKNRIIFLSTKDATFQLNKIIVGSQYVSIADSIKSKEYFQTGWGYIVEMKNGWKALFSDSTIIKNRAINNDSKISCFYQESSCK